MRNVTGYVTIPCNNTRALS